MLQTWLTLPENRAWLARTALKAGKVPPVIRNRLIKIMAARLAWLGVLSARLARWIPLYTALDIFFTSEEIASHATERRLTFMVLYARVHTEQSSQFGRLVRACAGPEWQYTIRPEVALPRALLQMP